MNVGVNGGGNVDVNVGVNVGVNGGGNVGVNVGVNVDVNGGGPMEAMLMQMLTLTQASQLANSCASPDADANPADRQSMVRHLALYNPE